MDKITVIVPAYNCQATIESCIKSIQNQTYKNLEIIVINDGSTDNTEAVLFALQGNDERIKVISIPNGGVSHARNIGLDIASGAYITFVDSDDYIDKEMYEILYNLIKEYNVRIAHCSYKNVDGEAIIPVGDTDKITVQNHDEAMMCLLSGKLFSGGIWNKLYKKELFDGIRFDESIRINEDVLANFELFDLVDESVFIDKALYSYVVNNDSATHSMRTSEGPEQVLCVAEKMQKKSINKPYQGESDYRVAYLSLNLYKSYVLLNNSDEKSKRKSVKNNLKSYKALFTKKDKLNYYLLIIVPGIYRLAFRVYDKKRVKQLDPT